MNENTASAFMEMIAKKAPEYLDLLTARDDEEFETAFDTLLERAVVHLETNKKNLAGLDEEGLSAVLAAALCIPGLSVTQETHSNGHVDLVIEADHCTPSRRKLAEAKIYDGPEYHIKGLHQLLERYSTGREGRGILIEYFRKKNIEDLVIKVRGKMDCDMPLGQVGATVDHSLKWSFLSTHLHSSGANLEVGHIGCNLWDD